MKNFYSLRNDFPILNQDHQYTYLDSAATAHKPQVVIDAETKFYSAHNAPVHRGLYQQAESATMLYEQARDTVARFINAQDRSEIIFTKGTTESINFIAAAWARETFRHGDEIVLTQAEHHANLLPWQWVAEKTGAQLIFIPVDPVTHRLVNPAAYITPRTKLVAVTHTSNVLGQIWDHSTHELEFFIQKAHEHGALVLLDVAQSIAHQNIDVQALNADFMAFSGHKMFGPTGIGVLYIKKALHDLVQPYQRGGSMVYEVWNTGATWAKSPQKFEAGTPPIAQAIGLGAAIEYIEKNITWSSLKQYEVHLCSLIIDGIKKIPGVLLVGNESWIKQQSGHVVSLAFDGIHPHDIATHLGHNGIAVRAGHFCAQPLVTTLGHQSLLRVSVAAYNNEHDIQRFLQALESCIHLLKTMLSMK